MRVQPPALRKRNPRKKVNPDTELILLDPEWEHLRGWVYIDGKGYPRMSYEAGHQLLHRFIVDAPKGVKVDHRNGNKLDARKDNLRVATSAVNVHNSSKARGSSGHRGVQYLAEADLKGRRPWRAYLKGKDLGRFSTLEMAVTARLNAEAREYGIEPQREEAFRQGGFSERFIATYRSVT